MVFCYQNCSDLLWEKKILVIEKNFWNSTLKFFSSFTLNSKDLYYGNRVYLNIMNSNQFVVTIRDQIDAVIKTKYPGKK